MTDLAATRAKSTKPRLLIINMPPLDDEAALLARFRALSTPTLPPAHATDRESNEVDASDNHDGQDEEDISDADVSEMSAV